VAETYQLEAHKREKLGKNGGLRRDGLVPAAVYGAKTEPLFLQIPYRALQVTLAKAGGTHIINLNVSGQSHTVLAREVQRDAVRREILHVDFFEVDKTTRISTEVPLHVIGTAPAETTKKGVLSIAMQSININALATQLPEFIEVNISGLKEVGDSVLVKDLKLPSGVVIEGLEADETVARINTFAVETEEVTDETAAEPEVIKKGKADEEEEA
jgi:large subunit ribosomal protein L25